MSNSLSEKITKVRDEKLPLVSEVKPGTVVWVRDVPIGEQAVVIAGPCSVESREQVMAAARSVKAAGAVMLRGGAYKPRTSPYDFQGLGEEGLRLLREAGDACDMPVVTEVMSETDVELIAQYADMVQIGARNMQNFALLKRVAAAGKPVLLKRGASATVKEWLAAAEYLLHGGNENIVLCERGIKTFEHSLRNTLDLASAALAKELTHLPVLVDPSHATGKRSLVPVMAKAALAAGMDGIIVEVHPHPENAWSDGEQSLHLHEFDALMRHLSSPVRPVLIMKSAEVGR